MEALTSDVQAVVSGMTEADKELIATGPGAPQRLVNFIREQSPRVKYSFTEPMIYLKTNRKQYLSQNERTKD
ncbi:hypothetical protein ACTXT7_012668 [Hymenolepis weldensis]